MSSSGLAPPCHLEEIFLFLTQSQIQTNDDDWIHDWTMSEDRRGDLILMTVSVHVNASLEPKRNEQTVELASREVHYIGT